MVPNGERERAEQSLREALDRLDKRLDDLTTGDPLIPFAEALSWAYSLEEWHASHLKTIGVDYYTRRDNDPDGKVTAGVIYARGLVAHQLASVGILANFDRYYDEYDAYGSWVWRPFSDLPSPGKKESHKRDKQYQDHVQHKWVPRTMRAVERFLTVTVKSYYP